MTCCVTDCSKASMIDGISGRMLKNTASSICHLLSQLFNLSLATATIPMEWKISNVVPVYKSGARTSVTNYQPISLLCLVSKLLERHIQFIFICLLIFNTMTLLTKFNGASVQIIHVLVLLLMID